MKSVGIAIIAKTPEAGKSKTRLSPPLKSEQCAEISACFIQDLGANIQSLAASGQCTGYALYTPAGTEEKLQRLLPAEFGLVLQTSGDLGARLLAGISDILALGHAGAIIVSSDSPTLPAAYFQMAVDKLLSEDCVVLCPAVDGGYTFIGLSYPHARLFEDMPWSTEVVHQLTEERAAEIGLPVFNVPMWYDVDDAATLEILRADLGGDRLPFDTMDHPRMKAPMTEAYLQRLADKEPASINPEGQHSMGFRQASLGAVAS